MTDPSPTPTRPGLLLTGERTLPGIADERYWFERHVVAYDLAARDAAGLRVLDAGCGEGYGLALLRQGGAEEAVGVDLDAAVVEHVTETYTEADAAAWAVEAELGDLPFPADLFDRAVSFQVIEHLWDVPSYLAELRRVVRPGGQVWIATPNRLTFTPGSDTPVNPFHVREFTAEELRAELAQAGLPVARMLGVHHGAAVTGFEAGLGASLPELLGASEPEAWPAEVRAFVHGVDATTFDVREGDDLDASLDLLAVCEVPA